MGESYETEWIIQIQDREKVWVDSYIRLDELSAYQTLKNLDPKRPMRLVKRSTIVIETVTHEEGKSK